MDHWTTVLLAAAALDAVAWAAFRLDKALARRGRRRISERALLALTALGGPGAMLGMYGHQQRHKTSKPRFVVAVTVATLVQLGGLAWLAWARSRT